MNNSIGIDELLAAAISGNQEAENELFSNLRARIWELAQQRIWNTQRHASEIRQDAENLTQDICFVILQKYKTASFHHGFMPWVMQITRHRIGQHYRERAVSQKRRDSVPETNDLADNSVGTEDEFAASELDDIISRALEKMGQPCVEIIEALMAGEIKAYIQQHTTASRGTIYSQIHRCRENLKILLREKGYKI